MFLFANATELAGAFPASGNLDRKFTRFWHGIEADGIGCPVGVEIEFGEAADLEDCVSNCAGVF
jgi:hypothetical protein